jgi:hypothetical protein
MSEQNIQILKFLFVQDWQTLNDATSAPIGENFASAAEILNHFQGGQKPSLVLCSLGSKKDLLQIATLIKISKKLSGESAIKLAVVNYSGNKQFEIALQKLGLLDIIEPSINAKGLKFKLNLWMRNLTVSSTKSNLQVKSIKPSEQQKGSEKKVVETNSTFLPAMTTPDDLWIHLKDFECKKILGRWLVRLMGPSPYVAQWSEVENKPGVWKFEFREGQRSEYLSGSGNWFFKGEQKPDFNWKENIWYFTGDTIDLFYFDEEVLPRLQLKNRQLAICENSNAALNKEQVIRNSFDKDLVFKKDVERLSNLEGKGGPDDLNGDAQLAEGGKGEASNSDEIQGKLKGKSQTSTQEGYLKSKEGGSEVIENEAQKDSPKERSSLKDPNFHNLQGKGKTDQLHSSDLKSKKSDANVKSIDDKFLEKSDSKLEESLKKTQKHGPQPMGEKELSEFKKALPEKIMEGDKGGSYSGKSGAEESKSGAYKSKESSSSAQSPEAKEGRNLKETAAQEYNDLNGKGKTDRLDRPNLHGKSKSDGDIGVDPLSMKLKEQEKAKPGFSSMKNVAEDLRDLNGKGKTDHLQHKDLSGKNKSEGDIGSDPLQMKLNEAEARKGNLGGKSSTDHLDHHGKKGPSSGGPKEGELQDYDNKNHKHETKYKGRLEAEKFDAKEGRKNQYREGEQDGFMGGGHGTEHLAKNYGTKEDSEVGTEKLDRSALGAKIKKSQEQEKGRSPHLNKEGPKKGKSSSGEDLDLNFEEVTDEKILPFKKPEFDSAALKDLKDSLHDPATEAADLLQTAILKAKIFKGDVSEGCKLDDFFEDTLMFELSGQSEFIDDVGVDLEIDYNGKKVNLKLKGVVTASDTFSGSTYLSVHVDEKENPDFSEFLNVYETRQKHITDFLMKVKGL